MAYDHSQSSVAGHAKTKCMLWDLQYQDKNDWPLFKARSMPAGISYTYTNLGWTHTEDELQTFKPQY